MPPNSEILPASGCDHPDCYGSMFPSLLALREDLTNSGTVFSVVLGRAGGMWRSNRFATADVKRWDECRQCEDFEDCYKLSMAKLALESAIQDR